MKITKRQLRRIIREAWTEEDEQRSRAHWATPRNEDPGSFASEVTDAKGTEVWEAVQQNVEEPSFAKWLGEELGSGPDPEYVMDAVQQNLNSPDFVDWLYNELGLGE